MKIKSLLAALAALLSAGALSAAVITPQQALDRVAKNGPAKARAIAAQAEPALLMTVNDKASDEPGCYVFSAAGGRGFMVLSADDAAIPVLAYSDTADFGPGELPDNLRYWLETYAEEIAAAREAAAASPAIVPMAASRPSRQPIAPLVTTKWDQSAPYNYKCPKIGTTRCVTGCTATAFAQVVNYYKHPAVKGTGTHTYTWDRGGKSLSLDYSSTIFDWDNMLDTYTGSEGTNNVKAQAVATLMYACGIAADMNYGTSASSGYTSRCLATMKENMGFSTNAHIEKRSLYSLLDWEQLIYNNLKEYGPMVYTGYNQTFEGKINVGHSFVCDGYSSDGYFHINWGWSGMSDGYYLLSSLDPESQGTGGSTSGYNFNQEALIQFRPAQAGESLRPYISMYLDADLTVNSTSVTLGNTCSVKMTAWSNSNTTIGSVTYGVRFISTSGSSVTALSSIRHSDLPPNYGIQNQTVSFTMPTSLSAGTYRMVTGFRDGDGVWHDMQAPRNYVTEAVVTVSGSRAAFSYPEVVVPEGPEANLLSDIFSDNFFEAEFNLTNNSDREYYGNVVPALLNATQNSIAATAEYMLVNLLPGESKQIKGLTMFKSITAGTYRFCLLAIAGQTAYIVTTPINVAVKPIPAGDFVLNNSLPNVYATVNDNGEGIINTDFTLTCTSGINTIYNGLMILDSNYSQLKQHYHFDIPMSAGVSRKFSYSVPLNGVSPGKIYYCVLFLYINNKWEQRDTVPFTFLYDSAVENVDADADAPEAVEYYDLAGRRVDGANLAPGHYLEVSRYADGTTRTAHRLVK